MFAITKTKKKFFHGFNLVFLRSSILLFFVWTFLIQDIFSLEAELPAALTLLLKLRFMAVVLKFIGIS